MQTHLENKVVLVTGAGGALGSAVVERFLQEGAIVHGTSHRPEPGGLRAVTFHPVDLTDEQAVEQLFEEIIREEGRLDVLANVAGGYAGGPIADSTLADLEKMLSMNLRTCYLCCRKAAQVMAASGHGGRIINIASQRAVSPAANTACYAASKAAVLAMTNVLAKELAAARITANTILPGTIDTPANRQVMPKADFSKWTQPRDIAEVMVFLASDASAAVSGAQIPV